MKILNHFRLWDGLIITHSVIVESDIMPNPITLAIECDYHPNGYGQCREKVQLIAVNVWIVQWISLQNCD
jgi:hypothetical protein